MIAGIFKKIFGSRNERLIRQYAQKVRAINAQEPQIQVLSDEQLRGKTQEFRERLVKGETLDALLPEVFAVVREAALRVHGMRHFDMQMIGGMVLHDGKIAEMRTGEGKTLTATLAVYLNALSGKGVHVVTVNDYLASRDADWMGRIYGFLGMTTGCNLSQMSHEEKLKAYSSDITYGTNNEFGFDYLRDNMVYATDQRVQRGLNFAIVDEVDSILIDEARTPLIISGQAEDFTEMYIKMDAVAPMLSKQEGEDDKVTVPGDYTVDLKAHQVLLTEQGHENAEQILAQIGLLKEGTSLYDPANILLIHHLYAALRAHALFHKDQHYVVNEGEIIIVDEFTGRMMVGRRWSDGLHQAVEAKEGVEIKAENQTLASITFQNYFRMYSKLGGMTGTADTEAYEFQQIYGLETVVIPTNKPMVRIDANDLVYRTEPEKYAAIIADIRECHERGQPTLVGTTSIESSEKLSEMLKKEKLPHQVLNAKQHEREAEIIVQAGRPGVITIATNMAGRGTDIVLGGSIEKQISSIKEEVNVSEGDKKQRLDKLREEWEALHAQVLASGGLKIIGTERHESRRIDNQLRGRAGRQGDAGASRFYLSLEDPLMKIFGGERLNNIMVRLKMPEGEPIEASMVNRSLESAQRKVEQRNFDIRKQLLEYDDVANDQRKVIYHQRNDLLETQDITDSITGMRESVMTEIFRTYVPENSVAEQWDIPALQAALLSEYQLALPIADWTEKEANLGDDEILVRIIKAAHSAYTDKFEGIENLDVDAWHSFERNVMLDSLDRHWREHLSALDHLRQGIHLRGYAQKDPKQEYKREAFELFEALLDSVRTDVTRILMNVHIRSEEQVEEAAQEPVSHVDNVQYHHADHDEALEIAARTSATNQGRKKVGRNDPCPCGSGKKYKHCHGKVAV